MIGKEEVYELLLCVLFSCLFMTWKEKGMKQLPDDDDFT